MDNSFLRWVPTEMFSGPHLGKSQNNPTYESRLLHKLIAAVIASSLAEAVHTFNEIFSHARYTKNVTSSA